MPKHPRNTAGRRGKFTTFAAAFAGVFLLGAVAIGVEFFDLHQEPSTAVAGAKIVAKPADDDRIGLEEKFREARDRTADARRQADAAEIAVFQFLNDFFTDASAQAAAKPQPEPSRSPVGPTIRPNPAWAEINRQLSELQRQRGELLVKLTPAHPQVQALDSQIEETRGQLAAIPAELPVNPAEAPNETPVERNAVSPSVLQNHSTISPPTAEMQSSYRELLLAAGHARDKYRAAAEAESAEWKICQRGGAPVIAMDRPGSVALGTDNAESSASAPANRPFPIGAVAVLTLLSIFAGMFAARRVGRPKLTFMSAAEIEATLGLPVLGRFGTETDRRGKDAA